MHELPGKTGYFEIQIQDSAGGGNVTRSKSQRQNTIVVYLYGPDGSAEMNPAPTDVAVKIGAGDSGQVVALSPQPKGGFASAPGHFPQSFRGQLSAKVGGEPVEASFMKR
jgi:hypothetical protein